MSVLERLRQTVEELRSLASSLEPATLSSPDVVQVLEAVTQAERVCASVRTAVSRRVEQSGVWAREGHKSPEHFLAVKTGTTPSDMERTLATAARLEQAPETQAAFQAGQLSARQAAEVAAAAEANEHEEHRLVELAKRATVKQLRDECRRVRHAATDERARYERIRKSRHLQTWTDSEGAFCGRFRTTPDAGARITAALERETDERFREARAAGEREPLAAYAIDALERLVTRDGADSTRPPKLVVNATVDLPALRRGWTEPGETTELAGIGPVPVQVIEEWKGDRYLRLLVTDGVDIKAVTRKTRYIDDGQRGTVMVREGFTCSVRGCDTTRRLEMDHCRVDFGKDGPTEVDNLTPLCPHHHALKTKGWRLRGGPGGWRLEPPDP